MTRVLFRCIAACVIAFPVFAEAGATPQVAVTKRLVILKVDGLNGDLLYDNMRQTDPATGRPRLPWFAHIFADNGTVFQNFYTRGISLSAPSWSMLDTGEHAIIRGNVEWDRYTSHTYDYLNFFPFYIGYARKRQIDMPGVEVLDRAGVPLLIDRFRWDQTFDSFQLYQRAGRWTTLKQMLETRFSGRVLVPMLESGAPSYDETLGQQMEKELLANLQNSQILYLDDYTGDIDHEGHATSEPAAMLERLRNLDALAGRIWTAIQASPLANRTLFVVVSDHGMNNVPGVHSQAFSIADLFNSPEGGGQHVMLDRHEFQDFKLRGLNPFVKRTFARSTSSTYIPMEQASDYPTAWLDLDGNERASVSLRNNDLNKIHILLLQLADQKLQPDIRLATAKYLAAIIDRHRAAWNSTLNEMTDEMGALDTEIAQSKAELAGAPGKFTHGEVQNGFDKTIHRKEQQLNDMEQEHEDYSAYIAHVRSLLAFRPDPVHPFTGKISDLVPERSLGDLNTLYDLQNYGVGPGPDGMVLDSSGRIDATRSFRHVNYFRLFARQRVSNNPQPALGSKPIDFSAVRLAQPNGSSQQTYWLYGSDEDQLLIQTDADGNISLHPVSNLIQTEDARIESSPVPWRAGLPLHLYEDSRLQIPAGIDREQWLAAPHSEREWLEATHLCTYSNGVIGITEELSPVGPNVPGIPGLNPVLLRYERRRRELVQPDIEVFAADHWNFNVRNFNPGGNHGGFFRISTHSVWMLAGPGIPKQVITEPYDSLNFASTVLHLLSRPAPMPDRVVNVTEAQPTAP